MLKNNSVKGRKLLISSDKLMPTKKVTNIYCKKEKKTIKRKKKINFFLSFKNIFF
jgi:hypothetical protein